MKPKGSLKTSKPITTPIIAKYEILVYLKVSSKIKILSLIK
jgi:hypothetical protein